MSGGSYGYVYAKVMDMADALREWSHDENQPSRDELAAHLDRVAEVMRSVEWADSYDTSWDDALREKIRALITITETP